MPAEFLPKSQRSWDTESRAVVPVDTERTVTSWPATKLPPTDCARVALHENATWGRSGDSAWSTRWRAAS